MPILSLYDVTRTLGITLFELWLQMLGAFVFSVLLVVKLEWATSWSWPVVFSPLFFVSALNAYFTLIVFLRQYLGQEYIKVAAFRLVSVGLLIGLTLSAEVLICLQLETGSNLTHAVTLCPIYLLFLVLLIRSCLLQCG